MMTFALVCFLLSIFIFALAKRLVLLKDPDKMSAAAGLFDVSGNLMDVAAYAVLIKFAIFCYVNFW